MARRPTRFSRVSLGWVDSARTIVDVDAGDTGAVFSVTGPTVFTGTVTTTGATTETGNKTITGTLTVTSNATVGGTLTSTGAATFASTVSSAGTVTSTGAVIVGAGTAITKVISSLMSIGGAACTPFDSTTSAYANNNAAVGDVVILTPGSAWSGAYNDLAYSGKVSTASTIDVALVNSTNTSITPDALNWRATLLRF